MQSPSPPEEKLICDGYIIYSELAATPSLQTPHGHVPSPEIDKVVNSNNGQCTTGDVG